MSRGDKDKMNKVIIDIQRIEFVITNACTSKCKHCSLGSLEAVGESINAEAAVNMIKRVTSKYAVESLMTFGGEPLLYADTVCKIHSTARDCGIADLSIITNGFFTRDKRKIESVAEAICASGVNDILLSVDAFHQEYAPIELVLHFARSLLDNGFLGLCAHPAWLVDEHHDNPYNNETKRLLKIFNDIGIESPGSNIISPGGNAIKYLGEYFPPPGEIDLSIPCGQVPYTSKLDEIRAISIEPNGDLAICDSIGNIYKDDVLKILNGYDPYASPEIQALMEGGAGGLLEYARSIGVEVDTTDCYTSCMVCKKIMSALKI